MRAYAHEIPGKVHEKIEDSHYKGIISDSSGTPWGLFMVADGLSGYDGATASHMAINAIKTYLEEQLPKKEKNVKATLTKAIVNANKILEKKNSGNTTLELALVSPEMIYTAHLGDGRIYVVLDNGVVRQVTLDENAGVKPGNYLGVITHEKSIEDRLNIVCRDRQKENIKYLLLTTDGLLSRATEKEITGNLAGLGVQHTPQEVLDTFHDIIAYPREKLLSLSEVDIRSYLLHGISNFQYGEKISKKNLVELILKSYVQGENKELVESMNRGLDLGKLKADDSAMIIVDLEDQVGRTIAHERHLTKTTVPRLKTVLAEYRKRQEELKRSEANHVGTIKDLEQTLAGVQQDLKFKEEDLAEAKKEHELYEKSLQEMKTKYNEEYEKNIKKDKEIEKLRLDYKTISEKNEEEKISELLGEKVKRLTRKLKESEYWKLINKLW